VPYHEKEETSTVEEQAEKGSTWRDTSKYEEHGSLK
jgi:hypothetical protein